MRLDCVFVRTSSGISVFISYRREDASAQAGRLYDRLAQEFGPDQIFMDVDTIPPGADFVERVRGAVGESDVLLAVIGQRWASVVDRSGRTRLSDPHDIVALEIASALSLNIKVIPVLVQDAEMPSAETLPEQLQPLARRNAVTLHDASWRRDMDQLLRTFQPSESQRGQKLPVRHPFSPTRRRVVTLSALLVLTLAAVAVLILRRDEGGLPHDVGLAPTGRLLYTTGIHTPNPTVGLLPRSAHIEVLDFDAGVTTVPRGTVQPACCGTWSPDGSSFAFESLHGIRVVDATTSQGELLIASSGAHMYEASNSIGNLWPTWSPDGHLIAYSFDPAADGSFSSDDEDRAGIWVADTDRNTLGQTQLTNGPDIRPAWAPGSDVAFVRADVRPHGTAFAIMSTVGGGRIGEQQLVGASGEVSSMAWSPDGTRLAYTRIDPADDEGDIWVLEPDGSTHPVIDGPGDQRDPAWSPDGKIIAFVSDREGSDDVFIMSLEDLRTEQVTSTESSECCLSWTGTK